MFGLGLFKHKRKLTEELSSCFSPLKDELGNVPVDMQFDAAINGAVIQICEAYMREKGVQKAFSKAAIIDAVFEEIYRRESINVQMRVDVWQENDDAMFRQGQTQAERFSQHAQRLQWLTDYSQEHFEQANNLML